MSTKREKLFGDGRPRALDRNAKVRITTLARSLMRRKAKGKAYGAISAKAFAVVEALLWGFHNARSGLCFPSYESIAKRAACARSTVAEAIKALEAAGVLSWVNRIVRVRERCADAPGGTRVRVIRTSNSYTFRDPKGPESKAILSKSEKPSRTEGQESNPYLTVPKATGKEPPTALDEALSRWRAAREAAKGLSTSR
jgi:hypothetical protein